MNTLGVSAGFHDAALAVIDHQGEILFASHSERYSKIKNDLNLDIKLLNDVAEYAPIVHVAYYEKPWKKQLRRFISGEGIDWSQLSTSSVLDQHFFGQSFIPHLSSYDHHLSHAAAGFQTSSFTHATVVVIDAIGELDTISIYAAEYDKKGRAKYRKLWRQRYPHSIGLFYSAMTQRVGLKPMDEEYILMGMSAYGKNDYSNFLSSQLVEDIYNGSFKENLHTGVDADFMNFATKNDIAKSSQIVLEKLVNNVMRRARDFKWSHNLVFMGGVALNCLANRNLGKFFENIWIMPNPGDAGSSLGAAALAYGKRLNWQHPYLGHNIAGEYPVNKVINELLESQIVGVASGRAEFGPRALGHRSLLADPRGHDIKDKVNTIKKRQKFRPFAPAILEEMAHQYFDFPIGWTNSPYMQTVARCRYPDLYPAICHVDGSSRVQTVPADRSGFRRLLETWYQITGCPMLLNTSLNVRGEPMVNDRNDADRFEKLYKVKVYS
jgi:carbamoyltransferase